MSTAKQTGYMPTRKLMTGAPITAAATEVWGNVMATVYVPVSGPEMSILVGMLVGMFIAYWVPDAPNVPQ